MSLERNVKVIRPVLAALLLAFGAVASPGCDPTGTEEHARKGGIEIVAHTASALTNAGVTQVNVTVTGPAENAPSPHTFQLTQTGGSWSGQLDGLPAGTYSLSSQALDAGGAVLFLGHASNIVVQPGQSTFVALNLYQVGSDPPFQNAAPFIDLIVAEKRTVSPNETISVRASATDANGDTILYSWAATAGGFASPAGSNVSWTAPSTEGPVTLTVTADDQHGATSIAQITIDVALAQGGVSVTPTFVQGPQVSSLIASNGQPSPGSQITVEATIATDPSCTDPAFCDPSSSWSSTCGATTPVPGNARQTTVSIDSAGPCEVRVDIFTGMGPHNYGVLAINATPPTVQYEDDCTPATWYLDADGDGHGLATSTTSACSAPTGYVASSDDCDDGDSAVHPGATDIAGNGVDEDCSGADAIAAANVEWVRRFTPSPTGFDLLAPTTTGVVLAHGNAASNAQISQLDGSGNTQWTTAVASVGAIRVAPSGDVLYRATTVMGRFTSGGSFVSGKNDATMTGSTLMTIDGGGNVIAVRGGIQLVKFDAAWNHTWESPVFGSTGYATGIEMAPDGTFNVTWSNSTTGVQSLTRVSSSGTILSTDTSSSPALTDFAFSSAFDSSAFAASGGAFISKQFNINSAAWTFPVPWGPSNRRVAILSNGFVVGVGSAAADSKQVLLGTSNGTTGSLRQFSSTAAAYPTDMTAVGTSVFVVGGSLGGTFAGQTGTGGIFVAKVNP